MASTCPGNSISYNSTQCVCLPGYLLNSTLGACNLFEAGDEEWVVKSGVDYGINLPQTFQRFESIKKFTQSEAVFLEATAVLLFCWFAFCVVVRWQKLDEGRSVWFRIRWWVSRLDICFGTRHWLADQKVVIKRKTELGGTMSVASLVFFIGLFAALLYQVISRRSVEVHNIRATNAPDFTSFRNDMEFNITTISSMSCSNLRGLDTLVTGTPGFLDQRVVPLSKFVNYSCHNTSLGPTVSLKCNNCPLFHDIMYTSWWFVDLPNSPAAAVGFLFNLTSQNRERKNHNHMSLVSGILKNGSDLDMRPVTFRGHNPNVIKFNLFPRLYRNFHDLKLVQPLLHEFISGSSFHDKNELQASLQSPVDGLINSTLYLNFLSAYLLEIDSQKFLSPVSFLADLGGLYCISFAIFFYILIQCEYRIKRLRHEDSNMWKIRRRLKAQKHWDKLRRYVMYTWDCHLMEESSDDISNVTGCCTDVMMKPLHRKGSSQRQDSLDQKEKVGFNQKSCVPSRQHHIKPEDGNNHLVNSDEGTASSNQAVSIPILELNLESSTDISELQKNIQSLYNYNNILRENLLATQSMLHRLSSKSHRTPSPRKLEKTVP